MIQLHIAIRKLEQANEIVKLLTEEQLITGMTILDTKSCYKNDKGEIVTILTKLLIGRTRAILFGTIEKLLKEKYDELTPVIYGMPIVNMDIEHSNKLKKVVRK